MSSERYISEEEMISYVREKGGISVVAAVIYIIALFVYLGLYIALMYSAMNAILSLG